MNNVEVELEHGFENYRLPDIGSDEELGEAVRLSWGFLDVAPREVTAPLLGAVYAAPLAEMMVPDFTLWLWGETGSYKSTVSALALSHYGDFTETNLPLSFESTSNALERSLFLAKDVLTVVDDWRPGVTRADSDDMDRKAQRLLRAVGNRQGRNRMTAETTLRDSYPPRGMVVATAEALPEGAAFQSAAARSMSVSIVRGDVDLATLSRLQARKHLLSLAVAGYVRFVGARYDEMSGGLARERDAIQEKKLRALLAGAHPRTPRNAATLIVGLRRFRDYSVDVGALNETQAAKLYEEARTGVVRAAQAHVLATSGGDPASRFVEILRSLFEAKRVYVRGRKAGEHPPDFEQVGWVASGYEQNGIPPSPGHAAEFIGWADEEHLYLEKNVAYGAVASFAAKSGMPFGIKSGALWEAMARSGKSLADRGRTDTTAKIQGQAKRVIQVPRPVVFDLG